MHGVVPKTRSTNSEKQLRAAMKFIALALTLQAACRLVTQGETASLCAAEREKPYRAGLQARGEGDTLWPES